MMKTLTTFFAAFLSLVSINAFAVTATWIGVVPAQDIASKISVKGDQLTWFANGEKKVHSIADSTVLSSQISVKKENNNVDITFSI